MRALSFAPAARERQATWHAGHAGAARCCPLSRKEDARTRSFPRYGHARAAPLPARRVAFSRGSAAVVEEPQDDEDGDHDDGTQENVIHEPVDRIEAHVPDTQHRIAQPV